MNLREMNYEIELEEAAVRPFERKVLESGLCDFAVPMSFFRERGKQKIRFECSGYVALSELDLSDIPSIFDVIEKTLIALKKSGEYLIDPGKITLTGDTIYVHHKHKDVRIAYIPGQNGDGMGIENVSSFFDLLLEIIPREGKQYIETLKGELVTRNRSLADLISLVGEMKREIFLCDIH